MHRGVAVCIQGLYCSDKKEGGAGNLAAHIRLTSLIERNYQVSMEMITEKIKKLGLPPLISRNFQQFSCDGPVIRVMQFNMLAQGLTSGDGNFIACPPAALQHDTRKLRIVEEILRYSATIVCLEECDLFEYLTETLAACGYVGLFFPKPHSPCLEMPENWGPDGCALFYKPSVVTLRNSNSFPLKEGMNTANQVMIMAVFNLNADSDFVFNVGVTHLKSKKPYREQRKLQGEFIRKYSLENCQDYPLIICGDFNAEPTEPVCELMKSSGLTSAYTSLSPDKKTEPKFTTWKIRPGSEECHVIDYIWYTASGFKVKALLDVPSEEEVGKDRLPSLRYPSDHISLVCDFAIVK